MSHVIDNSPRATGVVLKVLILLLVISCMASNSGIVNGSNDRFGEDEFTVGESASDFINDKQESEKIYTNSGGVPIDVDAIKKPLDNAFNYDIGVERTNLGVGAAHGLTFSPPWYVHDHQKGLLNTNNHKFLQESGLNFYQLWIWHLWPMLKDRINENTFGSSCTSLQEIRQGGCQGYNEAINALNAIGLPISVEVPGRLEEGRAKKLFPNLGNEVCSSLSIDQAKLYGKKHAEDTFDFVFDNWLRLGGRVDHISLDGMIHKLTKGYLYDCGFQNVEHSIQAMVTMVQTWQTLFKFNVEFSILVNFPNWLYHGILGTEASKKTSDYKDALNRLVQVAGENGIRFKYMVIDNPYPYFVINYNLEGTVNAITRTDLLIKQARNLGLEISYIANTSDAHISPDKYPLKKDDDASAAYQSDSIVYLDTLRYRYQRLISNYVVQSWHLQPYSYDHMMNLLKRFVRNTRTLPKRTPAGQDCSVHEYLARRPDVRADRVTAEGAINHYNEYGNNEGMCRPVNG